MRMNLVRSYNQRTGVYAPHGTRIHCEFSHTNCLGDFESPSVGVFDRSSHQLSGIDFRKGPCVRHRAIVRNDLVVLGILGRRFGREQIQLVCRYVIKGRDVHLEIFGDDFLWHVCQPVCELQGVEFAEGSRVEDQQEFSPICGGVQGLDGMSMARREVPVNR